MIHKRWKMSSDYASINRKLSISEMAQIHDITRQTLIYYDKIDLFKPAITEENGYRYYSTLQIPQLREICFLRAIGMPLDEIRKHNTSNSFDTAIDLLKAQNDKLQKEIDSLKKQQNKIKNRLKIYEHAPDYFDAEYKPFIRHLPERYVYYHPWNQEDLTRHGLHFALMRTWNQAEQMGFLPSNQYGSLIFLEDVRNGDPFAHAGCCSLIFPDEHDHPEKGEGYYVLPAADYACLQHFGMPYEPEYIKRLLTWIKDNDYTAFDNIYDKCVLDASFYEDSDNTMDFCELQIPIRGTRSAMIVS